MPKHVPPEATFGTVDVSTPEKFVTALRTITQRAMEQSDNNLPALATLLARYAKAVWAECFFGEADAVVEVIDASGKDRSFESVKVPDNVTSIADA